MSVTPRAKKRFGQHFLTDTTVINTILRHFAPRAGAPVMEIGPGVGALTGPLLDAGVRLMAVELDRDMQALLGERYGSRENFKLICGDILYTDIEALTAGAPLRVIGNLPYNITTPIIFHLLDSLTFVEDMYFMVQKEVTERLAAPPGGRSFGRPSVMVQRLCDVEMDFIIPPTAFDPPPRVMSAMLRLRPRAKPLGGEVDTSLFNRVVGTAFAQRRKTLRNALKPLVSSEILELVHIDPMQRAETVDVEGYVRLVREMTARGA